MRLTVQKSTFLCTENVYLTASLGYNLSNARREETDHGVLDCSRSRKLVGVDSF
jgi:hypothetical protein